MNTQPTKANTDAGWNDPPKFSYNESIEYTRSPKRNILNKRVAFPLNTNLSNATASFTDPTAAPCNNPNLPPPPTNFTTVSKCKVSDAAASDSCDVEKKLPSINDLKISDGGITELDLNVLLSILDTVIEEKRKLLSIGNKEDLIRKKIQVMKDSWESDKLPIDVKEQIFELANALKNENKEKANGIQIALMVDHSKLCSEFISAFRQLINAEESNP